MSYLQKVLIVKISDETGMSQKWLNKLSEAELKKIANEVIS